MAGQQAARVAELQTRKAAIIAFIKTAKEMVVDVRSLTLIDVETLVRQIPQWAQVAAIFGHNQTLRNVKFCAFLISLGEHREYVASYIQEVEDAAASQDTEHILLGFLWNADLVDYMLSSGDDDDYEGDEDESPRSRVQTIMNDMIARIT